MSWRQAQYARELEALTRHAKPKPAKPQRDPAFVGYVHTLDCRVAVELNTYRGCEGPIEAHHAGERGLGQRAADDTAIPLCRRCHRNYHDVIGFFAQLDKRERRAWADAQIQIVRSRYAVHLGVDDD